MSFNEQRASDFLDGRDTDFDEKQAEDFLDSKISVSEDASDPAATEDSGINQIEPKRDFLRNMGDYASAANATLLDTLGLPSDIFNFVAEKMGSERRVYGSDSIRKLGASAGITDERGQAPDTPFTKAGTYTGMGLQFLAGFLHAGKGVLGAITSGQTGGVTATTGVGQAISTTSVPRGVAQKIAAPFMTGANLTVKIPKTGITVPLGNAALMSELSTSAAAGVGAYYGEKEYGYIGELLGGLGMGLTASLAPALAPAAQRSLKKTVFGFTPAGGKAKAAMRLQELSETTNIIGKIDKATGEVLKSSRIPPAKLSGDKHLIALQEKILKTDPALSHKFRVEMEATNANAGLELSKMKAGSTIHDTQAMLSSRIARTTMLISRNLDNALTNAQASLSKIKPLNQRKTINQVVSKQIDDAVEVAKSIETDAWAKVPVQVLSKTVKTKETYINLLKERFDDSGISTAARDDIPDYIYKFFGDVKKGKFVKGSLSDNPSVKSLQTIRSRVLNSRRTELAKDAPNANKARILNNIQESLLDDMAASKGGNQLTEAIAVSRVNNEKFKGGIMDTILGHEKSGGRIAPEISLESIKGGGKGAVQMKEVLAASPESYGMLEDLTKVHMTQSSIINSKGRVNISTAKNYIYKNEDMLDMFPEVKKSLQKAVGMEERALYATSKSKERMLRLEGSALYKASNAKAGTVMGNILDSKDPVALMTSVYNKSGAKGKAGLRSDVFNFILSKAKTSKFNDNDMPILSGKAASNAWKTNKKVLSIPLDAASQKRLEIIINTLKLNADRDGLPEIGEVMVPANKLLRLIAGTKGANIGSSLGEGGGKLRTANIVSRKAEAFIDKLDVTRAKAMLTDAISDPELFKAIYSDTSKFNAGFNADKVFQSWLLTHTFNNLDINGVEVDGKEVK